MIIGLKLFGSPGHACRGAIARKYLYDVFRFYVLIFQVYLKCPEYLVEYSHGRIMNFPIFRNQWRKILCQFLKRFGNVLSASQVK